MSRLKKQLQLIDRKYNTTRRIYNVSIIVLFVLGNNVTVSKVVPNVLFLHKHFEKFTEKVK